MSTGVVAAVTGTITPVLIAVLMSVLSVDNQHSVFYFNEWLIVVVVPFTIYLTVLVVTKVLLRHSLTIAFVMMTATAILLLVWPLATTNVYSILLAFLTGAKVPPEQVFRGITQAINVLGTLLIAVATIFDTLNIVHTVENKCKQIHHYRKYYKTEHTPMKNV